MIIVLGDAAAAPGRRDELIAAARAIASATRADEGCVSYGFFADVEDGDRILSVEIWADRDALDAHMAHDHTQQFLRAAPGLVAGEPTMRFFEARPIAQHLTYILTDTYQLAVAPSAAHRPPSGTGGGPVEPLVPGTVRGVSGIEPSAAPSRKS